MDLVSFHGYIELIKFTFELINPTYIQKIVEFEALSWHGNSVASHISFADPYWPFPVNWIMAEFQFHLKQWSKRILIWALAEYEHQAHLRQPPCDKKINSNLMTIENFLKVQKNIFMELGLGPTTIKMYELGHNSLSPWVYILFGHMLNMDVTCLASWVYCHGGCWSFTPSPTWTRAILLELNVLGYMQHVRIYFSSLIGLDTLFEFNTSLKIFSRPHAGPQYFQSIEFLKPVTLETLIGGVREYAL